MQIKPNKTILEGRVRRVEPSPDGWGADVEFSVERTTPSHGYADFLGAEPGSVVTLFAAEPEGLTPGGSYRVVASVRGDPHGERTILETADATTD